MSGRKQRGVLNGQHTSWADVKEVTGQVLLLLLFLSYINDLPDGLNSNVKLFADDTSLFSVIHNIYESVNLLNSNLSKLNQWALQWKMSLDTDPTKKLKRS